MSILKVAKLAKVSSATVSRVINGTGPVKPATAIRVRKAMEKIGYVPKPLASRPGPRVGGQNFGANKTGTIAMVMCMKPSFLSHAPVLSSVVHGVEEALTQRGLTMVQVYVQPGNPVPPILRNGSIDGILLMGSVPDSLNALLRRHACVTMMSEVSGCIDHVLCDNEAIGKMAFEYLEKRGHRHVAFVTLSKDHAASVPRCDAFCRAAQQSGVQVDVFEHVNHWGYDLLEKPQVMESMCQTTVRQMLDMPVSPTGLFVCFDGFTATLFPVLKHHGIMPGKDVDVISCNNEPTLLAGLYPRPDTIDIQSEHIGRLAVEQLCRRIQSSDDQATTEIKLKPKLVINDQEVSHEYMQAVL